MNKERFNLWLQRRIQTQVKLTITACVSMALLGLLFLLIEGGLIYGIFSYAYGSSVAGAGIAILFFGVTGAFTWLTAPSQLADSAHEFSFGDATATIITAPTLSNAWTYAMGSMDSDRSIPQRILSILLLPPRLLCTSYYVFQRVEQVKDIDIKNCSKVIRLALKRSERIEAHEIADAFPKIHLAAVMRQLSLIDGVVFLTKESVGISIANRFKDDLEAEQVAQGTSREASDSPFEK